MGLFQTLMGEESGATMGDTDVRVAACALLLEMAQVDREFTDREQRHILKILRKEFELSREHAETLAQEAARERQESLDLWHFTQRINEVMSREEKIRVVELLWKVIYADGQLTGHEDYLVHKLADMLNLSHPELIQAKIHVMNGGD